MVSSGNEGAQPPASPMRSTRWTGVAPLCGGHNDTQSAQRGTSSSSKHLITCSAPSYCRPTPCAESPITPAAAQPNKVTSDERSRAVLSRLSRNVSTLSHCMTSRSAERSDAFAPAIRSLAWSVSELHLGVTELMRARRSATERLPPSFVTTRHTSTQTDAECSHQSSTTSLYGPSVDASPADFAHRLLLPNDASDAGAPPNCLGTVERDATPVHKLFLHMAAMDCQLRKALQSQMPSQGDRTLTLSLRPRKRRR